MSPNNLKEKVTDQYIIKYQIIYTYLLKVQRLAKEKEACKGIPGREITREGKQKLQESLWTSLTAMKNCTARVRNKDSKVEINLWV